MRKFQRNEEGVAALEFAIVLPLLLLLILAVIEFGAYFIKDQTAINGIGAVADQLRKNPTDPKIQTRAQTYGGTFLGFDKNPNFFCAQAYADDTIAATSSCVDGWDTARPDGVLDNEQYFIAIAARSEKLSIALSSFLPDINRTDVVTVGLPPMSPILASGEGTFAGNNSATPVFTLGEAAIVNVTCSAGGQYGGGGGTGQTEGWEMKLFINGARCARDSSWSTDVSYASFFVSASCIKDLPVGNHTVNCNTNQYGDGEDTNALGGRYGYYAIRK